MVGREISRKASDKALVPFHSAEEYHGFYGVQIRSTENECVGEISYVGFC
jgi:hypothetical protein